MESPTMYRKIVRVIKGGAKRLEEANRRIDEASQVVDQHRMLVHNRLEELRAMIPHKIGG
jgi:hypothetical protein